MRNPARNLAMLCLGAVVALAGCNKNSGTTAGAKMSTKISTSDAPVDTRRDVVSAGKLKGSAKPSRAEKAAAETARLEAPTTGTALLVAGKITFADGRPATSASVELAYYVRNADDSDFTEEAIGQTTTDDEGRYRVRGEGAGKNYKLIITGEVPETSVDLDTPWPMRGGLNKITRDITLSESFDVNGRVTNEKNEPMAGATVAIIPGSSFHRPEGSNSIDLPTQLLNTKFRVTTSTASGEFALPFIEKGMWTIGTTFPGYAAVTRVIEVPTTGPIALQLGSRGGTVIGSVRTKADGSPVAGLRLKLGAPGDFGDALLSKNTSTASDGSFRFENVTSTNLTLLVPTEETEAKKLAITEPRPSRISVGEGETTEVQLFVYPGITITGRVFDKDTNDPLPNATVTAVTTPRRTTTSGADGRYKLENVFLTSSRVSVNPALEGYALPAAQKELNFGGRGIEAAAPDAGELTVDLPMERQTSISGKVVTADEVPAGFAYLRVLNGRVGFSRNNPLVSANPDGTFKLYTIPFSAAVVEAQATGYADSRTDSINITTEDVKDVKIVLEVGGTVEGVVVDPSGNPAEGAKITNVDMVDLGGAEIGNAVTLETSGKDGKFTLTHTKKKLSLYAAKETFSRSEQVEVTVQSGETKSGVQLRLRPSSTIAGIVKHANGDPVEFGYVYCLPQTGGGTSSADCQIQSGGKFELDGLVEGKYIIQGNSAGHNIKRVENVKTGTENLEIFLDESGSPQRPETVTLIGTVVDEDTGQPIRDIQFESSSLIKKLDTDGQFEYTGLLPNNTLRFIVSAPGYSKQVFRSKVPGDKTRYEETFKLGHNGVITGRVIDAANTPLPDIAVVNWGSNTDIFERNRIGPDTYTITDNEGQFTLAPAAVGENYVQITPKAPLTPAYKKVTVKSGQTVDTGDIILNLGGKITGQVVRGISEEPVSGRDISISGLLNESSTNVSKSATSDKDGRFEFTELSAGIYTVRCGAIKHSIVLLGEESKDVKFKLGGVKMFGTLTRGGELVSQTISATGANGGMSAFAQGGKYTMSDVLPGEYNFQLSYGSNPTFEKVTVPDQEEFEHNFELPNGSINVTVINASGEPVGAVQVSLVLNAPGGGNEQSSAGQSSIQKTDLLGKCRFTGRPAGTYTVSASKAGAGDAVNPAVQVGNSAVDVQLVLK